MDRQTAEIAMRGFHGWYVVAVAVFFQMMIGGAAMGAFSLYVVPVSAEFGLSRADMNMGLVLAYSGGAIVTPVMGWVVDRFPIKPLLFLGIASGAVALIGIGLSHSLWVSALLVGACIPLATVSDSVPFAKLIVRWFNRRRGRALAISALGISAGGVVITPGIGYLVGAFGWRTSLMVSGAAIFLVLLIPLSFVREHPNEDERRREGRDDAAFMRMATEPAVATAPTPVRQLLRLPHFWLTAIGMGLAVGSLQATAISLVPWAVGLGMATAKAGYLLSLGAGSAFLGKLVLAIFVDKFNRCALLSGVFCLGALAEASLLASHGDDALLFVCAAAVGFGIAMSMPLFGAMLADRFGAHSYGTAAGSMAPIIAICTIAMTRGVGVIYDRTGDYRLAFAIFCCMLLGAAALIWGSGLALRLPPRSAPAVGLN